ncbi:MAG TPA: isoprenoid biosynthesis protein ElbB [Phycisphaerales bacterium]|nr:isoprenoid biosynthesis protein ElbB [Phycisphaerales bacterium]
MTKAAIILSGCGVFDGSEIHEAVSVLIHLSRHGAQAECFAPDGAQPQVINHLTGQTAPGETRNMLVEAARIARGRIRPLRELHAADFDAVFFPGGFGAAKNLSSFATQGAECSVLPEVERVLREFRDAGKPIAMCCIAPVIAARVFGTRSGGPGCAVTIGDDRSTAAALGAMGARHVSKGVTQALVDEANNLVTSPAYMHAAPIHEVYEGIGEMVDRTLSLVGAATR